MRRSRIASVCLVVGCLSSAAGAVDWPQFRGPNGAAISAETKLPTEWDGAKNVVWKVAVPGFAWSSPIVVGDKVFVTTAVADDKQIKPGPGVNFASAQDHVYKWEVYCLDATTGQVIWKQIAAEHKPTIHTNHSNSYATETPVSDGERVYAYFGATGGVFCYDLTGKLAWKADIGSYLVEYGPSSSPALDSARLFVQCDNEEKSFLVALDKKTGKEVWRVDRAERSRSSTPLVWNNKERTEVVCLGSQGVRSYDPATGKQLWELGGDMSDRLHPTVHTTPVASADLVFVGTAASKLDGHRLNKPLFAVKAGASGDITLKDGATANDGVAWYQARAWPWLASPLLYEGHIYVLEHETSQLACYDAKTGKQIYKERLGGRGCIASPWAYEGKVFCLADDGQTFVVQAGPQFQVLGKNKIDEQCWSSPAVAGGALFLRTVGHLYCIKQKP